VGIVKSLRQALGQIAGLDRPTPPEAAAALIAALRPESIDIPLIRLGPPGDGGYLAPDDLEGLAACLSPGVSTEAGFDLDMAERGLTVHMADASVSGPPVAHPRFRFLRKHLDAVDGAKTIRLDSWVSAVAPEGDLILQMDIEGAEWPVLLDARPETLARFRILIVEFHDLHAMLAPFGLGVMRSLVAKLLRTHRVVHLHPNNARRARRWAGLEIPPLMEITFHRRDRARAVPPADRVWPDPLDAECAPGRPPLVLPACWRP
jgi:hypothetical protein